MSDENRYEPFLKSLRVALTNVSIYFANHPIFIKSTQELEEKISELFQSESSLDIEISYNLLSCNREEFKSSALVDEMRDFFHRRKVKSISIEKGVSLQSLTVFLQKVNSSPKDILLAGGLRAILTKEKIVQIKVEDLDYSNLLSDSSLEYKYTWFYVLKKSLATKDSANLQILADNFERMLEQLDLSDPADLGELGSVIGDFFQYLRQNDQVRFLSCLSSLVKLILEVPGDLISDVNKFKDIFTGLETNDLAGIIFSKLQNTKDFDSLNFNLFSQLVKRENHEQIASSLAGRLAKAKWIKSDPKAIEKIKGIFSLPKDSYLSEVYRHNLSSILSTISLGEGDTFDRRHLNTNYRLMLLDLLNFEVDIKQLDLIFEKILVELSDCFRNNNQDYVVKFIDVFEKKRSEISNLRSYREELDAGVSSFLEDAIFSKQSEFDFSRLISIIRKPTHDGQFYLDKTFKQKLPNRYVFQIFFKFFSKDINRFCQQFKLYSRNIKLAKGIIDNLKFLDASTAIVIFKSIFIFSNDFIKLEILKAMRELSSHDSAFLFEILKTERILLRRQAFLNLVKYPQSRSRLAAELLSLSNPFGIRTHRLKENLEFIAGQPFSEARQYLSRLAKYKFFWNRDIRKKAVDILAKYGN